MSSFSWQYFPVLTNLACKGTVEKCTVSLTGTLLFLSFLLNPDNLLSFTCDGLDMRHLDANLDELYLIGEQVLGYLYPWDLRTFLLFTWIRSLFTHIPVILEYQCTLAIGFHCGRIGSWFPVEGVLYCLSYPHTMSLPTLECLESGERCHGQLSPSWLLHYVFSFCCIKRRHLVFPLLV